jgi:tellurite resistance protein
MPRDAFHDRERAAEAAYFSQHDATLIEKMRARAKLSEIAHAMAAKLRVDDPALLTRIANLGVTPDTAAAFLLSPLVEIAWADGHASPGERDVIVRIATARGVAADSPDMAQLVQWFQVEPPRELYESALDTIKLALSVLPPEEAEERAAAMINACKEVAEAPGSFERLLSLGGSMSPPERATLAEIRTRLGAPPRASRLNG